jgi:D-lactate dehydrogenase
MQIIFCDVNDRTLKFIRKSKFPKGTECIVFKDSINDIQEDELAPYLNAEIISPFVYSRLDASLLAKFKKLAMVAVRSTGYNNVDVEYCRNHGITLANVRGYGEITVAEFALGLLLSLVRKIGISNNLLKHGIVNVPDYVGIDVAGKMVGVIGTGATGSHFARLAHAMGCTVLAEDPIKNQKLIDDKIVAYTDFKTIAKKADIISLHCPATPSNYHMINAKAIAEMKDGIYIVNTARGELIDTADLYNALVSGKVAGAGLDVLDFEDVILKNDINIARNKGNEFEFYSLVNQKLLQLPNVIITPHIAFNSKEAELRILNATLASITKYIDGEKVPSVA